jgi:hypothetical protein
MQKLFTLLPLVPKARFLPSSTGFASQGIRE